MKSPISYPGGKIRLSSWIIDYFPEHELYCEPFSGSASVFFNKSRVKNEILNDKNGDMLHFLITVRDQKDKLKEFLQYTPYSREYHTKLIEKWWSKGKRPNDPVQRAGEYFAIMEMSYTGNVEPTGFSRASIHTSTDEIDTFNNKINQRIDKCSERLNNVCIENMDYKECIEAYDYENSLIYCDPPYFNVQTNYKSKEFSHIELAETIKNRDSNIIVSYGDELPPPFIDLINGDWNVVSQTRNQTVNHRTEDADEHLISNFPLKKNKKSKQKQL